MVRNIKNITKKMIVSAAYREAKKVQIQHVHFYMDNLDCQNV